MKPKISIVIPVYNESKNIPTLYKRLKKILKDISPRHEIIFIDDGSKDKTQSTIKSIRKKDGKVKLICFSRNFGHMAAINAGLKHSSGEKVVVMDADLQDPPEIILRMYKKSVEGFDVVYGVKTKRKEGLFRKTLFTLFYKILNLVIQLKMPMNAGTFSIMNARVVAIINSLPERNKYFSGLRFWTGLKQTGIVYSRGRRKSGKQASYQRLFKLAMDGLLSFSYLPLKMASYFGLLFAITAFLGIFVVLILRLFFNFGIAGWTSTIIVILLIGGVQLITLGIIGEYLARIYDEVKKRPEFIISEKTGFKKR